MSSPLSKLKVSIAQTCPVDADPSDLLPSSTIAFPSLEANLRDVVEKVETAKEQGADVVIFPEYFLQGIMNEGREFLSFPSDHLMAFLAALAKEHKVAVVGTVGIGRPPSDVSNQIPTTSPFQHIPTSGKATASTPSSTVQEEWRKVAKQFIDSRASNEEKEKAIIKNTAFFLEAGTGEMIGCYEKRNLWHPERDYLEPGKEPHEVFDTPWGKAGLMVCWDMSHPAHAQALSDKGAQLVFAPTYWTMTDSEPHVLAHEHHPDVELHIVQSLCQARSYETETAWIMCNAGGDHQGSPFMGGSGVWIPLQGKIGGFERNQVGVQTIDVDLKVVEHGRELYKIREDWSKRQAW